MIGHAGRRRAERIRRVSSINTYGYGDDDRTVRRERGGLLGEECAEPLTTLSDAGGEVTVATQSGNPSVIDERVRNPTAPVDAEPTAYDAVAFPGGHGIEWDGTQDRHARAALRTAAENGDTKAPVVCHAVGFSRSRAVPRAGSWSRIGT